MNRDKSSFPAIKKFIKRNLFHAGVPKVEIERTGKKIKSTIHTSTPGIIIGKKGSEVEKLKKELEYLVKVKRKEISEKIRHTASQGDLKENAGYDVAKEEQGFVEGRIKELKAVIAQAEVIEKKENGEVQMGSFVLLNSSDGKEKFQIVEPEEADILNNKISFKSPLGSALLNKKGGDIVRINTPGGKKEYKIAEVE